MKDLTLHIPETNIDAVQLRRTLKDIILHDDTLRNYARVNAIIKAVDEVIKDKDVKGAVLDAASLYPDKTFEYGGAQWTKRDVGVRYDYSACGDPVYDQQQRELSILSDAIKRREKYLQSIPQRGEDILDPATGELITIYPPARSGRESVTCKLL